MLSNIIINNFANIIFQRIIYIYNYFKCPVQWQKLLGSARSGSTALSYRNCVITPS